MMEASVTAPVPKIHKFESVLFILKWCRWSRLSSLIALADIIFFLSMEYELLEAPIVGIETSETLLDESLVILDGLSAARSDHKSDIREFFWYLRELPGDVKHKIMLILLRRAVVPRYDYTQMLHSDYTLSLPAVFSPTQKVLLVSMFPKNKFGFSIMYNIDALLFDLETGQVIRRLRGGLSMKEKEMAFSRDGKLIVVPSETGFYVFATDTGELVNELVLNHTPIALSPDGRKFVTMVEGTDAYFLNFTGIDLEDNGKLPVMLERIERRLDDDERYYEFSSDCKWLYSKFEYGLWDASTGDLVNELNYALVLAISPDCSVIATLSTLIPGAISIMDATNFGVKRVMFTTIFHDHWISCAEISPNNALLALASDIDYRSGMFHVWDTAAGVKLYTKDGVNPKFTPQNDVYVVHSNRSQILIWRGRTGTLLRVIPLSDEVRKSSGYVSEAACSPYSDFLYVGLETGPQIITTLTSTKTPLMKFNRCHLNDPSWVMFVSLYRLFYGHEREDTDDVLVDFSSFPSCQASDNDDEFLFSRVEISNKEPCCDSSLVLKGLLGLIVFALLAPLSPILIPIGFLAFCCCNISDD